MARHPLRHVIGGTRAALLAAALAARVAAQPTALPGAIATAPLLWVGPDSLPSPGTLVTTWPNVVSYNASTYNASAPDRLSPTAPSAATSPRAYVDPMTGRSVVRFYQPNGTRLEVPATALDLSGAANATSIFFVARLNELMGAPCGTLMRLGRLLTVVPGAPDWFLGTSDTYTGVTLGGGVYLPSWPTGTLSSRGTPWALYELTRSSSGVGALYVNGSWVAAGSTAGPRSLSIGGNGGSFIYNCPGLGQYSYNQFSYSDVAELLVYNTLLADGDRHAVEAWLAARWALSSITAAPSTTPSASATPLPSAAWSMASPATMSLVSAPPTLWVRPNELPPAGTAISVWPNAALTAAAAAATAAGNFTVAAALTANASASSPTAPAGAAPYVVTDPVTGYNVVRFTSSRSTQLVVPPSALDLSGVNQSLTIFVVARTNVLAGAPCGSLYLVGRPLTVPASSPDWALGWSDTTRGVSLGGGLWLPGAPPGANDGRSTAWTMYSLTRDGGNGGVGSFYANGSWVASGSTFGPRGLALGGNANTFSYPCPGLGTYYYPQFADADVAEVVSFNRLLSDSDRRAVEAWLASKWALGSVLVASTTPSPSATPLPSAAWSSASPATLSLVTAPPTFWVRPNELPSAGTAISVWPNAAFAAAAAAAATTGNSALAAALTANASASSPAAPPGSAPYVVTDPVTGYSVVRFTSARSTQLVVPPSQLDLSGVNQSLTIFVVARINALAGAPCGSLYKLGRPLTVPASSPDWALGWSDTTLTVSLGGGLWLPNAPPGANTGPSNAWSLYTLTRDGGNGGVGSFYSNGSWVASGSTFGPRGLALGGNSNTFMYSCPGIGTYYYPQFSNADVGEVVAFNRLLSDSDRRAVEAWLASKWALGSALVASTTPSPSATPLPSAAWSSASPATLSLVTAPPTLWVRPNELPSAGTAISVWPNAAFAAAAAAAATAGNTALAAALTANASASSPAAPPGSAPYVVTDPVTGYSVVRFTSARSTQLVVPPSQLDLSGVNQSLTIFVVARINALAGAPCGSLYKLGRPLTVPASSPDWALGWSDTTLTVSLGGGLWLPNAPPGANTGPSNAWSLYTLTRDGGSGGVGSFYSNGSWVASGSTFGPRGLALGGNANTFSYPCPGLDTNYYPQFSNADVGEVVAFNRLLSDSDRRAVEAWLASKWALGSVLVASTTPSPSATPLPSAAWSSASPATLSLVTAPPTFWVRPNELPSAGTAISVWPNAAFAAAAAAAATAGNSALAAALTANASASSPAAPPGSAPYVVTDPVTGYNVVRFTSARSTQLVVPPSQLDLSGVNQSLTIFVVARINALAGAPCGSLYRLGRPLTVPASSPDWALGWSDTTLTVSLGGGLWLPNAPPGANTGPSNAWSLYTLTRDGGSGGVGSFYSNGSWVASGSTFGPRGLALGGNSNTFTYSCPGIGTYYYPQFSNADVGEVVAFNRLLSDSDRRAVEAWLASKWALGSALVASTTPSPSATPLPSAAWSSASPATLSLVTAPPTFWVRPNELPSAGTAISVWPNAAFVAAAAAAATAGNTALAAALTANASASSPAAPPGSAPYVVTDPVTGYNVVRFTSARSTQLVVPPSQLDLSGVNQSLTIFVVARINALAGAPCGSLYRLGRPLTVPASSPDWALGWSDTTLTVSLGGGLWLPNAPPGANTGPSNAWSLYTLTRDGGSGGVGSFYSNGSWVASGSTFGPRGLALGGNGNTFTYSCPGIGTYSYSQFSNADVGEVVAFNRLLSDSDRRAVEAWLASKWALGSVLVPSTTPSPSATPLPPAAWSASAPSTLSLVTAPPTLWLRPDELPADSTGLSTWPNAALSAAAAAASAAGNASLAATLAANASAASAVAPAGSAPYVVTDVTTGYHVVRFTSSRATQMVVPPAALDLSGVNATWTVFLVARINTLASAPCNGVYKVGRPLTTVDGTFVVGWSDTAKDCALGGGTWLPGPPSVAADARSTQWVIYTFRRNGSGPVGGALFRNGTQIGRGATLGPRGLALGGSSSTFWYSCPGIGTYQYSQFADADIAEVVLFSRALSDADRQAVETYLGARWRVFMPGGVAVTPAPTSPPPTPSSTASPSATQSVPPPSASRSATASTTPTPTASASSGTPSMGSSSSPSGTPSPSGTTSPSPSQSTGAVPSSSALGTATASASLSSSGSVSGTVPASPAATASPSSGASVTSTPPGTQSMSGTLSVPPTSPVAPSPTLTPSASVSHVVPPSPSASASLASSASALPTPSPTSSSSGTATATSTASGSASQSNTTSVVGAAAAATNGAALSPGATAGVAIGGAVALALLVIAVAMFACAPRRRHSSGASDDAGKGAAGRPHSVLSSMPTSGDAAAVHHAARHNSSAASLRALLPALPGVRSGSADEHDRVAFQPRAAAAAGAQLPGAAPDGAGQPCDTSTDAGSVWAANPLLKQRMSMRGSELTTLRR